MATDAVEATGQTASLTISTVVKLVATGVKEIGRATPVATKKSWRSCALAAR